MISVEILGPVIALVAWSLVMWIWMYATRIPAMFAANMKLDPNAPRGEQLLAWVYVVLRVAHSLLQALVNKIEVRFAIFVLSNIPLFALTYIAAREYLFRIGSA